MGAIERITLHFSHAEISLYATAASKIYPQTDTGETKRLDFLYACLMAAKRYFDCFFTVIPTDYASFSGLDLIEGARCLYTLFRLTVLERPGWDREAVRSTVDILQVLDRFDRLLQQAQEQLALRTPDNQPGNLNNLVLMVRRLRGLWGTILSDQGAAAPNLAVDVTTQDMGEWESFFSLPENLWIVDPVASGMGTLRSNGI